MPDTQEQRILTALAELRTELHELKDQNRIDHTTVRQETAQNSKDIREIRDLLAKYKGFLGGALAVLSIVWGVVVFIKTWIIEAIMG